jgi:nucleotide-binding universal stress UspA family protein
MGTIVCGYDGSDPCRAALEQAVAIARDSGDTVVVVFGFPVSRLGGEVPDYANALHERAATVEKHARDQAAALGAEVEVELLEKEAAEALVEVADARDARLIVVGTHGESTLKGVLIGSTPHKLLQVSGRPVLCVPDRS